MGNVAAVVNDLTLAMPREKIDTILAALVPAIADELVRNVAQRRQALAGVALLGEPTAAQRGEFEGINAVHAAARQVAMELGVTFR